MKWCLESFSSKKTRKASKINSPPTLKLSSLRTECSTILNSKEQNKSRQTSRQAGHRCNVQDHPRRGPSHIPSLRYSIWNLDFWGWSVQVLSLAGNPWIIICWSIVHALPNPLWFEVAGGLAVHPWNKIFLVLHSTSIAAFNISSPFNLCRAQKNPCNIQYNLTNLRSKCKNTRGGWCCVMKFQGGMQICAVEWGLANQRAVANQNPGQFVLDG